MCVCLSKIILTDSNLFFYLYAFLGNPQLLIITRPGQGTAPPHAERRLRPPWPHLQECGPAEPLELLHLVQGKSKLQR